MDKKNVLQRVTFKGWLKVKTICVILLLSFMYLNFPTFYFLLEINQYIDIQYGKYGAKCI